MLRGDRVIRARRRRVCATNPPKMADRDHYEVLGLPKGASPEDIKAAFRKLASQHHPDRNPDDPQASVRFKELNASYQVLSDPQRRAVYDRFGHRGEAAGSPFGSGGPFPGGFVDMSELNIDGFLGDLLGVFGVGRGDKGDIKRDLEISFEEAAFGSEKDMRYARIVSCSDCGATGSAPIMSATRSVYFWKFFSLPWRSGSPLL